MGNGSPASLSIGLLFADSPRVEALLTGQDPRLVGSWMGDTYTVIQRGGRIQDVVLRFTESALTMETPTDPAYVGDYFCDTSTNPMRIDWHVPSGLVRGLYTFGTKPESLILVWNRASTRRRPADLNDSESVFSGPYIETPSLLITGGLDKIIE
ncbi:MAG: hypothetical protein IT365_29665 [Candidatus Hydrogenedentes bacterium]|nr:hypothetical protein [Candidatus Hydrogenedentota bacterium]